MNHRIAILAVLLATPAVSDDAATASNIDIVIRAFDAIHSDFAEDWAFTQTSTTDGITQVGEYDPRFPDGARWTLVSVDNREPTAEEIEKFVEQKRRDKKQRDDDNHDNSNRDIVNFETLELVEETAERWVFSFTPNGEEDDSDSREFMKHVDGTVTVVKDGHFVESIDLRNQKPIKPAVSVKIRKFITTLRFGPAIPGGPIVPLSVDVEVKGRAMLVIKFDETESLRFHDYRYSGP